MFLCLLKVWSIMHNGSVGQVQNKKTNLCFYLLFWHSFVVFYHKICVFYYFHFFFLMKYQIFATEYKNQSETRIRSPKLSDELYVSSLFKLEYYTIKATLICKQHVINYKITLSTLFLCTPIKFRKTTITRQF